MLASYTLSLLETYAILATLLERRYSTEDSHNTGSLTPYSFQIVYGFIKVPNWTFLNMEGIVRWGLWFIVLIREDLKSNHMYRYNCKGSTFSSVILRPWVILRSFQSCKNFTSASNGPEGWGGTWVHFCWALRDPAPLLVYFVVSLSPLLENGIQPSHFLFMLKSHALQTVAKKLLSNSLTTR